jgi:signal transduction histidine kinase
MSSSYAVSRLAGPDLPAPAKPEVIGSVADLWRGPGPHLIEMQVFCRALLDQVAVRARLQHVKVRAALPDVPIRVIGFADELAPAVHRLLTNALDVMQREGTLTLRLYLDPYVVIECCDTGPAIPASEVPDLWRSTRGVALAGRRGLPEVKAVAEQHRGRVYYRQQPDGGRCFIVELPVAGPRSKR